MFTSVSKAKESVTLSCAAQTHHKAGKSNNSTILKGLNIQKKLTVGQPNDEYEQEADRVADQVMRMPDPAPAKQRPWTGSINHLLQTQPVEEEEAQAKPLFQRQPIEEEEEPVQMRTGTDLSRTPEVGPNLEGHIHRLKGGGQPLSGSTRTFFEPRFGRKFNQVRVHTDSQAAKSAQALNARAFTTGHDIVFGTGQYAPETIRGKRLLSHELTHVVQQRKAPLHRINMEELEGIPAGDKIGRTLPMNTLCMQPAVPTSGVAPTKSIIDDAQKALFAWHRKSLEFVEDNRIWLSYNYIDYLGRTSSNPRLGWSHSTTASVIGHAVGKLLGKLPEKLIKKGTAATVAALIGTKIAPGVGTVIGFIVGTMIDTIAYSIFQTITGKTAAGKAMTKASRLTASMIKAKEKELNKKAKQGRTMAMDIYEKVQNQLNDAKTENEVFSIRDWAINEHDVAATSPPATDRSLFERMLHDWVLEHAGDEEDASKQTEEYQWEKARDEVFGKGDLDNHPEIFAYQTRGQWGEAGLPGEKTANRMIAEVEGIKKEASMSGKDPADEVYKRFDSKTYVFHSTKNRDELQKLANFISRSAYPQMPLLGAGLIRLSRNKFTMKCFLDLTTSDGSCYVNEWEYHLSLPGPEGSKPMKSQFDVSPD